MVIILKVMIEFKVHAQLTYSLYLAMQLKAICNNICSQEMNFAFSFLIIHAAVWKSYYRSSILSILNYAGILALLLGRKEPIA